MTSKTIKQIRTAYRERNISSHYSGPRHLATTISLSLFVALFSAIMLADVHLLEWLTIPLTFLYANLAEYIGHRGPMHHKIKFFYSIFKHHSIEHHSFFTDKATTCDTTQDFKAILVSPSAVIFFNICFALPVATLLYLLMSPNVSFLFALTAILYFLNYELLHLAYHMDPQSRIGRLPFMGRMRSHHLRHHNKRLMTRYNFNVTYPICDYLFGTVYKDKNEK